MSFEMKFAVDLLWLRPGGVGGTEVVARNLLDGMRQRKEEFHAVLITSLDNSSTFVHYAEADHRFEILQAPIASENILKRILWQNLHLNHFLRKHGLRYCFSPVYDRPFRNQGVRYITTIHDIQAYHYPEYHPFHEVVYSKLAWRVDRDRSDANVAISNYVAEDLVKTYHFQREKIRTIYDPVILNPEQQSAFGPLADRYGVSDGSYYYTVGQLIPHKNMGTLLKIMHRIHTDEHLGEEYCKKLLITGINGNAAQQIREEIAQLGLEDAVVLTGYLDIEDRNALYAHAKCFLFPSVFEGFGLPPLEAMMMGTPVVATRCACIPEVTQNLAEYVDDPYDPEDWLAHMKKPVNHVERLDRGRFDQVRIAGEYLEFIKQTWEKTDR